VIDWLTARFRRRFPYEGHDRWSQSLDQLRLWTEALEAEGVAAVRRALERSRAGAPGLIRIGQTRVTQGFAEAWLDWHDSQLGEMAFSPRGGACDPRLRGVRLAITLHHVSDETVTSETAE
jgi:hypothetical protein